MDECGRGPLAGPLVAAATILNIEWGMLNVELNDSKKLSDKQRNELYKKLIETRVIIEIESISVLEINTKGIGWANVEVFKRLVKRMKADKYIVDGSLKIEGATSIVKADTKIPEVMAASIVAKVTRDRIMRDLHSKYPNYGWDTNVGYGTKKHIEALREHGPTEHHREVFVRTALKNLTPNSSS